MLSLLVVIALLGSALRIIGRVLRLLGRGGFLFALIAGIIWGVKNERRSRA